MTLPATARQAKRLFSLALIFCTFLPKLAPIMIPWCELLRKDSIFSLSDNQLKTFQT